MAWTAPALRTGSQPTTLAVVSVDSRGERDFQFIRGADCTLSPEEVDEEALGRTKFLHFGSVSLTAGLERNATIFAARHAHRAGVLVSYDPNYRAPLWKNPEEAAQWMAIPLPLVDVIKLSEEELPLLTGTRDPEEGSRLLEERGISLILVTLGERGAFCRWRGESFSVPGASVQVADTNGAGDTFLGAVLGPAVQPGKGADGGADGRGAAGHSDLCQPSGLPSPAPEAERSRLCPGRRNCES